MSRKTAIVILTLAGILTLTGTIPMGFLLRMETSGEALLSEKAAKAASAQDTILLILKKKDGDVFTDEAIENMLELQKKLEKLPEVIKVDSILKAEKVRISLSFKGVDIKAVPYFPEGKLSETSRQILKDSVYVGNLINNNGDTVAFAITLKVDDPKTIIDKIKAASSFLKRDFDVYLTGMTVADAEVESSVTIVALFYPPLLFFLVWLIYYLRLGSASAALVPPIVAIIATLWSYEVAAVVGIPINLLTATVGIFVIIISSAYGLHFIDRYIAYRKTLDFQEAITLARKSETVPILLSAITTAAAFFSFLFTPIRAFKQLGILVAIGVMLSAAATLVIIPAIAALFDIHSHKKKYLRIKLSFGKFWGRLAFIVSGITALLFFIFIGHIQVGMDEFSYFKKSSDLRKASTISNETFGWTLPVYLYIEKDKPFTTKDEKAIKMLLEKIEKIRGVNGTMSAIDLCEAFKVPLPLLQLASGMSEELRDLIERGKMKIMIKTPYTDTLNTERLVSDIGKVLKEFPEYSYKITGPVVDMSSLNTKMVKSQYISMGLGLAFIFVLLLAIFKKPIVAIVGTIPVVLTSLFNFTLMAISKLRLDIATSIVSGLLMGLVIDYAIHFISKYLRLKSVKMVIEEVGAVILSNSIGLSAGFATLILAPLLLYARLGLLLSLGIMAGTLYTMLVMPPILEKIPRS